MPTTWTTTGRVKTLSGSGAYTVPADSRRVYNGTPAYPYTGNATASCSWGIFNADQVANGLLTFSVESSGIYGITIKNAMTGASSTGGAGSWATQSGSWAFSIDMEEITGFDPGVRASYSQVPSRYRKYALRPKLGGSWSMSCGPVSLSGTINSTMAAYIVRSEDGWSVCVLANIVQTKNKSYNLQWAGTVDGYQLGGAVAGAWHQNVTSSGFVQGHATANYANGLSFTQTSLDGNYWGGIPCNATGLPIGPGGGAVGGVGLFQTIPVTYNIIGDVRQLDQLLPGNLALNVNYSGAGLQTFNAKPNPFTIPITLQSTITRKSFFGNYDEGVVGEVDIEQTNVLQDVWVVLASPDTGDVHQPSNLYLPKFSRKIGSLSISQASRYTLDPCTSATGWSGVSLSGGALHINTGATTTAAVNFGSGLPKPSESYRYLAINITSPSGAQPLTVTVQTKAGRSLVYSTQTPATTGDVVLDLCQSTSGSTGSDGQISRWPNASYFTTPGSSLTNSTGPEGQTWGANAIVSITMVFASGTGSYTISEVALKYLNPPTISVMNSDQRIDVGSSLGSYFHSLWADTDGRRSLEIVGSFNNYQYNLNSTSGSDATSLAGQISKFPGWSVSYSGEQSYIGHLAGGGNDGTRVWWRHAQDGTSIPIIELSDLLTVYPNAGDFAGGGVFGTNCKVECYGIVRSSCNGIVENNSGIAQGGQVVIATNSDGTTANVTTDLIGRFAEGVTYSPTGYVTVKAQLGTPNTWPSQRFYVYNRFDYRVGFQGVPSAVGPSTGNGNSWHIQNAQGRLHVASIVSGDIVYRRSDYSVPANGAWAAHTQVTTSADVKTVGMAIDPSTGRINIHFTRQIAGSQSAYVCYSDDDGATWSNPTTV